MHPHWTLAAGQHAQTLAPAPGAGDATRFLLYLPQGFEPTGGRKWPLLVFLHGSGERGDDIEQVKLHGPPKLLSEQNDLPFIVVSPQAPAGTVWNSTAVHALIDAVMERLPVDPERVYLTGLSLGGHGTWNIAASRPERFAAIAPVCGAGDVALACQLKGVPVWAFHGQQDSVVKLQDDAAMVEAVRACGGDVKFTVYPDLGHDAWTRSYANPALYDWLLQHRRSSR